MPLTKSQIIEIQESAKFNYAKQLREKDDKKALQEAIDERMKESSKKSEPAKEGK